MQRPAVLLAAVLLSACVSPGTDKASPFRSPEITMAAAQATIIPGQSTRAEVLAALGPATTVRFDSGFEVWAWRDKPVRNGGSPAELVVLFTPAGVVQKLRSKPAYPAP